MKKILFLFAIVLTFSACNKCVECTQENFDGSTLQYETYDDNGNSETHGDWITEICSDNFESKKDFNSYIDEIEEGGADCKSDFWN